MNQSKTQMGGLRVLYTSRNTEVTENRKPIQQVLSASRITEESSIKHTALILIELCTQ